ncbi:hypothetical protein GQK56_000235, partial [Salmonella enterica subsp. enterica serovar Hadar]|nr:hypothetical protein [Salmonella enterica subsp. enterica serovar Hadar]
MITFPFHVVSDPFNKVILNNFLRQKKNLFFCTSPAATRLTDGNASYRKEEQMRILLVEDDTLIGDGIKAGLSKMGFSVDWFTEGRPGKE